MVAAQDEEVLRVLDLVGQQEADGLERLLATVDVVTKEEVVGLRREATVLEEAEKVVVLAVDVTTDLENSQSTVQVAAGIGRLHTLIGASSSRRMG